MHDHELALIADLVEGRLEDETEARALIASSPELQHEYEVQTRIFETLSGATPVTMTEAERAALHRDVWTVWRAETAPSTGRAPWYYRWVSMAAGLFVVVGLVAVLSQANQEGATETFSEVGSSLSGDGLVTTTAAASGQLDSGGEGTDSGAEAPFEGETSAVPTEEDLARALTAPETAYYSAQVDEVRTGGDEVTKFDQGQAPENLTGCVETAGLEGFEVIGTVTPPEPTESTGSTTGSADETTSTAAAPPSVTTFIVAIPEDAELDAALVAIVELDGCQLVYFEE